jgi:molybdopterin molybdotransferase
MITVQEASEIIMQHILPVQIKEVPLTEAAGCVLQEEVEADRDFPPFNRVTMDGIAIQYQAWQQGVRSFHIEGVQKAGEPQKVLMDAVHCLEVMTGAVLPQNADTVIRYEDIENTADAAGQWAKLNTEPVKGQNIHVQGSDRQQGEVLIKTGVLLGAAEIAVAASVGKALIKVSTAPKIAIISTGDELVEVGDVPQPHQIRKSNVYMLNAAVRQAGAAATLHHLPDNKESIVNALKNIIATHDALILSGGVSMGKADFIPEALEELGVQKLFHKVKQRPGKPFWFGVSKERKAVFALPGNPVSTFLCYYRYVLPWLKASLGLEQAFKNRAVLTEDVHFSPDLQYFLPVSIEVDENARLLAEPSSGGGSGDFANLLNCDGFLELPVGREVYQKGEAFELIRFK